MVTAACEGRGGGRIHGQENADVNVNLIVVTATIPPTLQSIAPTRQARGIEFEATVMGTNLEGAEPYFDDAKLSVTLLFLGGLACARGQARSELTRGADLDNAVPYRLLR